MKRPLYSLLAALLVISLPALLAAQLRESVGDHGTVDWSNQVVQATGIAVQGGVGGRAGQIRAAELDALRQILETVKGMRLSSETTVEEFMLSSDRIRTEIEGVAKNFKRVGDPIYASDGSIELTVQMEMTGRGQLYDALLSRQDPGSAQRVYIDPPRGSGVYTGLIVDTRGLGVRPALSPKIEDTRGNIIYGERYVDRDWLIQQGMVGYATDIAGAKGDDRIGSNPLVIQAERAAGPARTDVVISDTNARLLHGIEKHLTFLQQARVIFVVDQE